MTRDADKRAQSYLCLLAGTILLVFSNGIFAIVPIASWLAPIFLLRFLRIQHPVIGLTVFGPIYIAAWILMLFGILPELGIVGSAFGFFYGVVLLIPYAVDRALTTKLPGYLATLVFPACLVIVEYFLAIWDVTGSWFSLAYTQHDNLPLIQLVSVTGLWGVTFLIAWFASIVNWLWEENFDFVKVWKGAGFYLCLLVSVHLYGGIYMAFAPADADTVRIASVTRSFDMDVEAQKCRRDSSCLGRLFEKSLTEFIGSSKRAVDMGASIVLWQENGVAVFADDEAKFVDAAAEFSTQESIFLVMSVKVVADKKSDDENKAILISPQGERAEYLKNYQVAGDEHILGDGSILIRSSIHGTLGTIICKDFDYPDFVRQAGLAEVDIMLIPSHDWRAIDPYHARMAHLRAIENGYSMISANYHGTSTAIDFHGNALGLTSDFKTDELIMLSDIPTQGIRTIYSVIGDLFAWLNGVMLAGMIYVAWRRG